MGGPGRDSGRRTCGAEKRDAERRLRSFGRRVVKRTSGAPSPEQGCSLSVSVPDQCILPVSLWHPLMGKPAPIPGAESKHFDDSAHSFSASSAIRAPGSQAFPLGSCRTALQAFAPCVLELPEQPGSPARDVSAWLRLPVLFTNRERFHCDCFVPLALQVGEPCCPVGSVSAGL